MNVPNARFANSVFINCPFDSEYAPLLEAAIFCVVYFGFTPRLANERLEAGEVRFNKILGMMRGSMYSIHDLSRCKSSAAGEYLRMNMPFEYGIDVGLRNSTSKLRQKKFLIFESDQFDLKKSLSDTAGQDVSFHQGKYEKVIKHTRDFFQVEANTKTPGPARLISDYVTFQGWMLEKKIDEGHSEEEALALPTAERIQEMKIWRRLGMPNTI